MTTRRRKSTQAMAASTTDVKLPRRPRSRRNRARLDVADDTVSIVGLDDESPVLDADDAVTPDADADGVVVVESPVTTSGSKGRIGTRRKSARANDPQRAKPAESKAARKRLSRRHRIVVGVGALTVLAAVGVGLVLVLGGDDGDSGEDAVSEESVPLSENPVVASYQTQLPALAEAVRVSPADPTALRAYGVALYATGDVDRAKDQYEAELKVNPSDAVLLNNLGNVYRDLGIYDKALEVYQQSISLDAGAVTAYINLSNLYQYTLQQPELSVLTLQEALVNLPDNQDLGVLLGISYEQTGDDAKATEAFEAVLEQNADNPAAKAGLDRVSGTSTSDSVESDSSSPPTT